MDLNLDVLAFIKAQVHTIDDLLLNAYGTVYKFAAKQLIHKSGEYELSSTEEMLSAKNLFSNLCSILDFCCTALYSHHNNEIPTLEQGMKIKFPCSYNIQDSLEQWEEDKISQLLGYYTVTDTLEGIFHHVQFIYEGPTAVKRQVYYFYLLRYLRNTLTHHSIEIRFLPRELEGKVPDILQELGLQDIDERLCVASEITIPKRPWLGYYDTDRSTESVPLLDVLYQSCRVVEECRDKILSTIGEEKFGDKFKFKITMEQLKVTLRNGFNKVFHHKALHLECYGMEAELKEQLDEIRKRRLSGFHLLGEASPPILNLPPQTNYKQPLLSHH